MAKNTQVEVDPKEIKRAQDMWAGFMTLTKQSVIITVIILALLGIALIDW